MFHRSKPKEFSSDVTFIYKTSRKIVYKCSNQAARTWTFNGAYRLIRTDIHNEL